jgi:hypothetical protein
MQNRLINRYIIRLLVFSNQIAFSAIHDLIRHLQIQPSPPATTTISENPRLRWFLDLEISFTSNWKKTVCGRLQRTVTMKSKCAVLLFSLTLTPRSVFKILLLSL